MNEDIKIEVNKDEYLRLLSYPIALENLGVYCAAVTDKDGNTTERTEYGNGWNAHGSKLLEDVTKVKKFLNELPPEVLDLVIKEVMDIYIRGELVELTVNSSDLFGWGYSDCEEVKTEDMPQLMQALEDSPNHGGILWVCRKYKQSPQKPYYKYFNDAEKILFDACAKEGK